MIKILLITNLFPNSQEPNRGIFNYHIVKELQAKCQITVIAPVPWFPRTKLLKLFQSLKRFASWHQMTQIPKQEQIHGVDVHHPRYIIIPGLFGFIHAISLYFPLKRLVKNLCKTQYFDVLNAHWVFPDGVAAVRVAKKMNLPIMLTAHGCDINLYPKYLLRRTQIRKALLKSNSISVVSPALKERIIKLGVPEQKVQVIPNGVDLDQFAPVDFNYRKQLKLPLNVKIILFVGALEEVKGIEYLLEAVKIYKENLFVAIVGDGSLRHKLIQRSQELDLTDRVAFFGAKQHDEIPLWMNACDLFCLPSLREGWPCVIMEALACGKPVVASRVGGIPKIINEQNGYLVEPQNAVQLAHALEKALSRSWDHQKIREMMHDLSWKSTAEKYYNEYVALKG